MQDERPPGDNIIPINGRIFSDADAEDDFKPDDALEHAKGRFNSCIVLGWNEDDRIVAITSGNLRYISDIVHLMERYKHKIFAGDMVDVE